jgi:hypothetical protein
MAVEKTIRTSSIITATSQHKRDYSEKIRRLYPSLTKILALVKGSNTDNYGNIIETKGMIEKKAAKRLDPEWATYTPIDILYTTSQAGGGSTTAYTLYFADITNFETGDKLVNTNTGEVCIVADTTTYAASNYIVVTEVTGSTWSSASGDVIAMLLPTYEEGSSRYQLRTKELDTNKTYLEVSREAISIAETIEKTPQYTEEGMMERYMTDEMWQYLRKVEANFLFSKTGTSGTTSVSLYGVTGAQTLYSMQGILAYAGSAYPMNGGFNWDTFNTLIYPILPKTMHPDETIYFLCGRKVAAAMNMWAQNKYVIMQTGGESSPTRFGVKPEKYLMGGGVEVEPIVHDLFEGGQYANMGVFFQNSDLVYRFMEGLDIQVKENIQLPSTMGRTNEVRSVLGLQSWSNGAAIKVVKDLLPTQ